MAALHPGGYMGAVCRVEKALEAEISKPSCHLVEIGKLKKHKAILKISYQALLAALKLPADVKIDAVRSDVYCDTIELIVEHPSLPASVEGDILPRVSASYKTQTTRFEHVDTFFDGWK